MIRYLFYARFEQLNYPVPGRRQEKMGVGSAIKIVVVVVVVVVWLARHNFRGRRN